MWIRRCLISARCEFLVDTMGAERVMLGSDYPFPLGEHRVGELIRSSQSAFSGRKQQILGENAVEFLGLETQRLSQESQSRDRATPIRCLRASNLPTVRT